MKLSTRIEIKKPLNEETNKVEELGFGIVNFFHKGTGITNVAKLYEKALKDSSIPVNWLQCTFGDNLELYDRPLIKGVRTPIHLLTKFLNIMFILPNKVKKYDEKVYILSDPWAIPLAKSKKCVLIFHDDRQLTAFRDNIFSGLLFRILLSRINRVGKIICVSVTAKIMLKSIGVQENKIIVVRNALQESFGNPGGIRTIENKRNLNVFYIATIQKHKNIDFFLKLANQFHPGNSIYSFHLLVNSRKEFSKHFSEYVPPTLMVHEQLDDVVKFYNSMDILVFPSLYEGFGLPLIEAMSMGIPIIAYDIPTVRETLGNCGLLVDTFHVNDWKNAIEEMSNPLVYKQYSDMAIEHSKEYTYERFKEDVSRTVNQLLDI